MDYFSFLDALAYFTDRYSVKTSDPMLLFQETNKAITILSEAVLIV